MIIADIITEFGAYYIKNESNMARMVKQLMRPFKTQTVLTPFFTDDTIYRASESRFGRILQPFQKAFTPLNVLEFIPVAIEQFKIKADSEEYPDDLEGTWLGFMAGDGIDRKEWPFIRWFIEVWLIPQMKEDMEMNEIYKGVYAAPTPGTAGAVGTSLNGLKKAITDNVTAGRITPIVTGIPDADPKVWVEQIESFADSINKKYWNIPMQLCMNETLERRFYRGYQELYGKDTDYKERQKGAVDFTNLTIIGLPSMQGSNKIWCTPKENSLLLMKKTQNMNNFQVESVDRRIKFFTDFWTGVGFVIPEIVFVNDQA